MSLTKILWKLGLTKKKSELITPTLINIFKISHKHFYQGNSNLTVDHILGAPNLGLASSGKDIYHINLNNGSKSIVLDNMLIYNSYEVGDLLKLSYQEKYLMYLHLI